MIRWNEYPFKIWITQKHYTNVWESFEKQNPSPEDYYRLGNLFYEQQCELQAEIAWKKASSQLKKTSQNFFLRPLSLTKNLWKTVGGAICVIICFYILLFILFPREEQLTLFELTRPADIPQKPRTAWEEWWDTGRPSVHQLSRQQESDGLWSLLQDTLERLLNPESEAIRKDLSIEKDFFEWLDTYKKWGGGLNTPMDYYLLAGKGFFNSRRFTEAIQTYYEGLQHATSPRERGIIYQELGTTYYYQGYQLQPNGLAKYDLNLVKKSVDAYIQSAEYLKGPYLFGNLGWGYYLLQEYEKSIIFSKMALALDPQLNYVRMNLGITFLRIHDYLKTFEAYETMGKYQPNLQEYEGGIRDIHELQTEFPGQYPFTSFILGYLYYKQGNYRLSQREFERFIQQPFPVSLWKHKAKSIIHEMGKAPFIQEYD